MSNDAPIYVSVKDAARLTSLCEASIYNFCNAGKIAYTKLGRRRLIHRESLMNLLGAEAA